MTMALWFTPSEYDIAHDSLEVIFSLVPRIALGSLIAYAVSQMLDVSLFEAIKKRFPSKKLLFLRNVGSTFVSQFIDTLIFVPIAFLGEFPNELVIEIFWTTYVIKLLVAILDTPFVYLISNIKPLNLLNDDK